MSKAVYKVTGMSCHGCERSVELAVSKIEGVKAAIASAGKSELEVLFEDAPTELEIMQKTIDASGYKFVSRIE